MERKLKITRRFAFALEVLVLFVLQGIPRLLPPVLGNTPSLLICAALTIAIAENELCAMFFGLACGLLTDLGFSNRVGYFTVVLTVVCFFVGYFTENFFVANLLNTMLFSVFVIFAIFFVQFVIFNIFLINYSNPWHYFLRHHLIRTAYTVVCVPPLYGLNMLIRRASYNAV